MKKLCLAIMLFFASISLNAVSIDAYRNYLTINDQSTLQLIKDYPVELKKFLDTYDKVIIKVSNSNWVSTIKLPSDPREGSVVRVTRDSNWDLRVSFENVNTQFNWRESYKFTFRNGKWTQTFGFGRIK